MLSEERHQYILAQLARRNRVVVSELCATLKVSLDTVRRDLKELEKAGKLLKVHGGAVAPDFHFPYQQAEVYARHEKQHIARKAMRLIEDGMTLLAGGGTVMLELARMIPENLKGTFFTVSPLVALEVTQRSRVEVILLAGRLLPDSYICTGSTVVAQLSGIRADLCLMGANDLSIADGLTESNWEVAQVKKAMLRAANKNAILCLSEKLGTSQKIQVCKSSELDILITELAPGATGKFAKAVTTVL